MATECEEPGEKCKQSPLLSLYQMLKDLCLNNAEHFRGDDTENGQRLHAGFLAIIDHVNTVTPLVEEIRSVAPYYDFDEKSPGNGYRSFVAVVDKCVQHGINLCRHVVDGRDSFLFRKGTYMREVEACSHVMASLGTCLQHLKTLLAWSRLGELFPVGEHSSEELLKQAESINMYCFYGRCLGFQFCESMQTVLKTISICMASFSEIYYGNGGILSKATNSVWTGGKYLLDPELRARRIVNISQHAQVDFCKSFWLLAESELMSRLPGMICPSVAVNKVIAIPPEPLCMPLAGEVEARVLVPVPSAHVGAGPVYVRLICATRREGMIGEARAMSPSGVCGGGGGGGPLPPPSSCLLLHVHGGGFVAQSSRSHESYLRDWAQRLQVPIVSVDYSLAPAAPYPRALEEVLFAYCWALKNCRVLGSTAEHVLLVGDSAGGNLNLGLAMKCIEMGIRRPSALFLAYVPVLVSFVPSPSRLLCLMDPLLPFGFMIRCLKAYACPTPHNSEAEESSTATEVTRERVSTCSSTKTSLALGSSLSAHTLSRTLSRTLSPTGGRPSPTDGHAPNSQTESFEEVSESDLLELAAHKSPMSELGSDTLTTVSLASLQSRPETDLPLRLSDMALKTPDTAEGAGTSSAATPTVTDETPKAASRQSIHHENHSEQYVSDFLEKYVLDTETDSEGCKVPVLREADSSAAGAAGVGSGSEDEHVLFELPPADLGLSARLGRAAGNIASGVTNTFQYITGHRSPPSGPTPSNEPPRKLSRCSEAPLEMSALDTLMQRSPSEEFQFSVPRDPFLSPYWAEDEVLKQLPPLNLLSVQMDPCLDDCVMFAKKLKNLGNTVHLDVLEGLPHGFLNFALVSKEAHSGSILCVKRIQELIDSLSSSREL